MLFLYSFLSSYNRLRPDKRCDCQVGHWTELMVSTESEVSELYRSVEVSGLCIALRGNCAILEKQG